MTGPTDTEKSHHERAREEYQETITKIIEGEHFAGVDRQTRVAIMTFLGRAFTAGWVKRSKAQRDPVFESLYQQEREEQDS